MNSVEAFGFSLGKLTHLGGDDLEAVRFETGVDLADDVLGNASGLMMERVRSIAILFSQRKCPEKAPGRGKTDKRERLCSLSY